MSKSNIKAAIYGAILGVIVLLVGFGPVYQDITYDRAYDMVLEGLEDGKYSTYEAYNYYDVHHNSSSATERTKAQASLDAVEFYFYGE